MAEVAVVLPAFNPNRDILESLGSVLRQTLLDLEVVVVDDGSDPERFPTLPSDPRLRVVHQPNGGVSRARNRGVELTTAPLIAFIDQDDRWDPRKLCVQMNALASADVVLTYTGFRVIDPGGRVVADGWADAVTGHPSLLRSNPIMAASVALKRDAFLDAGGFDPSFNIAGDWDLWLRLIRAGRFVFIPSFLADYRIASHMIGQQSADILGGFREVMSIYDREQQHALERGDAAALDAISYGRASLRRSRSRSAAERFIDSLWGERGPEWSILGTALRISPAVALRFALRALARRTARRIRGDLKRLSRSS